MRPHHRRVDTAWTTQVKQRVPGGAYWHNWRGWIKEEDRWEIVDMPIVPVGGMPVIVSSVELSERDWHWARSHFDVTMNVLHNDEAVHVAGASREILEELRVVSTVCNTGTGRVTM